MASFKNPTTTNEFLSFPSSITTNLFFDWCEFEKLQWPLSLLIFVHHEAPFEKRKWQSFFSRLPLPNPLIYFMIWEISPATTVPANRCSRVGNSRSEPRNNNNNESILDPRNSNSNSNFEFVLLLLLLLEFTIFFHVFPSSFTHDNLLFFSN